MGPLISALAEVIENLERPCALIGGLAVAARLSRVERVTADVDTVVHAPDDPPSAEVLIARGIVDERVSESSVIVKGIKVDLIDTFAIPGEFSRDVSTANDHFVAAHRFGFESATPLRLLVPGGPEVTVSVATPAGLVGMKLHAARWRHNRDKVAGDLFDIYRLLTEFDRDGEVADTLGSQPGLNLLCLETSRVLFIERLTATTGSMSASNDAVIASVGRELLGDVGEALVRSLGRSVGGR